MKIRARKQKAEPKKPAYKIQLGKMIYRYMIGISWIQMETSPETDWPEMPEYMQVCFAIDNPNPEWASLKKPDFKFDYDLLIKEYERTVQQIEAVIIKAIKAQVSRQRKTHGAAPK